MKDKYFEKCKICDSSVFLVNEKFKLLQCKNCELIFSQTFFDELELKNVYDKLYNDSKKIYYKHSIIEYENLKKGISKIGYNRKKIIDKYIKDEDSVLEIGSGIGVIGYFLKLKGVNNYLGIELDKKSHEKAKEFDLNSINGSYSLMSNINEKFDIIMLWEVLEHIQDLKEFFDLSYNKLNDKGKLIFSVPNYYKRFNVKYPKNELFQSGPPIHLNYFTQNSINSILNIYGYKPIKISVKKFPYLNHKSLKYYKNVVKSLLGLYIGSTIYVIAEKIN